MSSIRSVSLLIRWPAAALCAAALLTAGCDRQKAETPQPTQGAESRGEATPRYRVDRSHAGSAIPTATVKGPGDVSASLTTLSGKPMLLNLWATWCAPCIEELPTLNRLATDLDGQANVIALSQDIGDDPAPMRRFLNERGWDQIAAWHDPDNAVGLEYGGSLPTTILFDAQGKEVLRVIGALDWYGDEAKALLREAGM
jgi:thiol-disulfide isomerase/thioredoxin